MGSFFSQGWVVHGDWVVRCKRCGRDVPAGVDSQPAGNIVVSCPLCRELRRYRAAEVFLGRPDMALAKREPESDRPKHKQYRREA